jgi:hypothetical protein
MKTIGELKNSAYAMLETGCLVGGFSFLHGCLGSLLSNDCKYKIGVDQMNCRIKIK